LGESIHCARTGLIIRKALENGVNGLGAGGIHSLGQACY
jgi:hypothetical protein